MSSEIPSEFKAAFGGGAEDAARFLSTLDIASTPAPSLTITSSSHISSSTTLSSSIAPPSSSSDSTALKPIPYEVIQFARRAEPSALVDDKAVALNWISPPTQTGSVAITDTGMNSINNIPSSVTSLMRFRLETFAEQRLEKLFAGSSSVVSSDLQLLNETDFWALTHGLWLLCSSKASEGQRSHHGFTNYMMGSQWWSIVGMKYAMSFASAVSSELFDSKDQFQATLVGVMSEVDGAHPRTFFHPLVILSIPDKADVFKRWLCEMYEEERRIYGPAYSLRTSRSHVPNALDGWKLGFRLWSKAWELTHDVTYSLATFEGEHTDLQLWMEWIGSNRSEIDMEMLEADRVGAEVTGSLEELIVQHDLLEAFYLERSVQRSKFGVFRELNVHRSKLGEFLSELNQAMDRHELGPKLRGVLEEPLPVRRADQNPGDWTDLHEAMFQSPYGRVWRLLLSSQPMIDLNARGYGRDTSLLTWASRHGDPAAVAVAVEGGIKLDVNHIHDVFRREEILALILKHPDCASVINVSGEGRLYPLAQACHENLPGTVAALIAAGANSSRQDGNGHTCWHYEAETGTLDLMRALMTNGNAEGIDTPSVDGMTPLNIACAKGHLDVVRFLLHEAASQAIDVPNNDGWTPLNSASDSGHLDVVRYLLSECQSEAALIPNNYGVIPLWSAVVGGHDEIAALLAPLSGSNAETIVEAGKLFHCAKSGIVDDLQSLLQLPAYQDVDSVQFPNGSTALMFAAEAGRGDLVTVLIDGGSSVNHVGRIGTALHCAARKGHDQIVSQLLAAGADPSLMDEDSKTALQVASTGEVKALLRDLTTGGGEEEIEID